MTIEAVISRIRAFAAVKGWSKREYARNAKIQDTTLRDFDKENWNPTRKTLRRMEGVIPSTFDVPQKRSTPAKPKVMSS